MKTLLITTALCVANCAPAIAETCAMRSPTYTVALLELYTSEGCDSCPPADRFVSGLRAASGLGPDKVVPLSLHVDYWDYIGWKDAFAKHAFTERQRWLSGAAKVRAIYTPEVFVAGNELRNWRGGVPAMVKRINERPAQADIAIVLGKVIERKFEVEVSASAALGGHLFVALYENGLTSDVKAGENRGATLRHDYVVRDLIGPIPFLVDAKGGKAALSRVVSIPLDSVTKNLGISAFVQSDRGEVLQALALPVCSG